MDNGQLTDKEKRYVRIPRDTAKSILILSVVAIGAFILTAIDQYNSEGIKSYVGLAVQIIIILYLLYVIASLAIALYFRSEKDKNKNDNLI